MMLPLLMAPRFRRRPFDVLPALQPSENLGLQTAATGAVGGELSAGDRAMSGTVRPGLGHDQGGSENTSRLSVSPQYLQAGAGLGSERGEQQRETLGVTGGERPATHSDDTPAVLHRYVTRLYQRQGGQSWTP